MNHPRVYISLLSLLCILIGVYAGILTYSYVQLKDELTTTRNTTGEAYRSLEAKMTELEALYTFAEETSADLREMLEHERGRNEDFEDQIQDLSGTVGQLDKLSKLDPRLLQKYSKIYFLNEHYAPAKVLEIDSAFVRNSDGMKEYVDAGVAPFLKELLNDAKDDGISLFVTSGYRSFDEQAGLKGTYSIQYGSGANAFSADQGYSEHQLGTTVDFSSDEIGGGLSGFETTAAYAWLLKHAYRYGFILSYPQGNTHYIFEPWHWRFVGTKLADDLHDDRTSFYDLEQREIDTYLISIFD